VTICDSFAHVHVVVMDFYSVVLSCFGKFLYLNYF